MPLKQMPAKRLFALLTSAKTFMHISYDPEKDAQRGIILTGEQLDAVMTAVDNNIAVITGGPGHR